jgi:predicted SnoaL-like aldol condensation-catalyzing enzyme
MFEQYNEVRPSVRTKIVHLILNGHPEVLHTHEYSKPLRKQDI